MAGGFRGGGAIILAAVLLAAAAGCASAKEDALGNASAQARQQATRAKRDLDAALVGETDLSRAQAVGTQAVSSVQGQVLASRVVDSRVQIDATFVAESEGSGGFSVDQAAVRLCVRYVGRIGPHSGSDLENLTCPPALPHTLPYLGKIDKEIRL